MDHNKAQPAADDNEAGDMNTWSIPFKSSSDEPSPSSSAVTASMGTIPRKSTGAAVVAGTGAGAGAATGNGTSPSTAVEASIPRKRPSQPLPSQKDDDGATTTIKSRVHGLKSHGASNNNNSSNNKKRIRRSLPSSDHGTSSLPPNVVSTAPFVIRVSLKGVPWRGGHGISLLSNARASKRDRPIYQELEDTDDDDDEGEMELVDSDDDDDDDNINNNKPKKSRTTSSSYHGGSLAAVPRGTPPVVLKQAVLSAFAAGPSVSNMNTVTAKDYLLLGNESVEAPPPGALTTLWYSREAFVNTHVMEKIIGWKTRPVTQLEWDPNSTSQVTPSSPPELDPAEAAKLSSMALTNPLIWRDPSKRMEVSRLVHEQCPVVLTMACAAQPEADSPAVQVPGVVDNINPPATTTVDQYGTVEATNNGVNGTIAADGSHTPRTNAPPPRFRIKETTASRNEREEVFLVKWRGRSHLHVSWERESDLIKYDQSNNTARSKIRRFLQSQELAFGQDWKQVLEAERTTAANIHAHGELPHEEDLSEGIEEEYYPPAATEVERILACDESEMSLTFFAKQRAVNILDEQDQVELKDSGHEKKWNSKEGLDELLTERAWDPEDNVRYVVKWKGLPFAEMTWEYWRDIKRDAVDEAEDFWLRQKPPKESARSSKPHPDVRDFKKIQESPLYGISKRKRPIAESVNGRVVPKEDEEVDDVTSTQGLRLRNYQLEGVNWLLFNWWNHRSCILADEMGLGKTIQSVGFLKMLQDMPNTAVRGPFLIVAPLSLVGQWQSEIATWAPDLNVVLYHGSADARGWLVKQEFYLTDQFVPKTIATKLRKQNMTKFHVLITTYEVILKDIDVFKNIQWKTLIVDEAHRLKNPKAKLFEELMSVPRDHCVLLTGTPLANATEELWALLHFANPQNFPSKEGFLEKFGQLTDADQVRDLHAVLKPYLLRRVKEDVEKSLPPKEETILEVSLTPIQKKYYKAIFERNTAFLFKGTKPSNAPSLMNVMMELRKCCNHPYLVRGAEERILAEAAEQAEDPALVDYRKLFGEQLVKSSGKMVLIHKLLPKLFSNGHKVLIFSQMVRVLDLLEELLKVMKYKYERLDGSTSSSSRTAAVDRFKRASCQRFVMLLSTRAGGLGLNLTAADIVIIFDSDWNPQNDLQAMARAHRIGQTRSVRVYRLLTAKTYEMHMFHSASMKLGLERAVLSQQREQVEAGAEKSSKSKSKQEKEAQAKEIDQLLKKGAYDVFRDEDDEEGRKFMETDIDQLLESSAKKVTYGQEQNNLASGLGSFSKASFVADTGDGEKDVDLDDPDFWSKAVGLEKPEETPEEVKLMVDDGVKRSRKQVEQFDPYADEREAEERKQAKIDSKVQADKEEKERLREEKRKKKEKKLLEKERKRKEKEERRASQDLLKKRKGEEKMKMGEHNDRPKKKKKLGPDGSPLPKSRKKKHSALSKELALKLAKDPKLRKLKKIADRKRALRRAENANPPIERLRQAWDAPQRNRVVAAFLRFGFGRFVKIRSESSLQSLPIQDIEVFLRTYAFQLGLQLAVSLMEQMKKSGYVFKESHLQPFLAECLGPSNSSELEWLSDCLSKGMQHYLRVEDQQRLVRMPLILTEPTLVANLRRGPALRSLRRIYIMCRLERIVKGCLDSIIAELGYEQLGQRGCATGNASSMDIDLKARLVSSEELKLSVGLLLRNVEHVAPAVWWDRSCDIALLIGTFVHGLGNYEAMLHDESLPFAQNVQYYARIDPLAAEAHSHFLQASKTAAQVCEDAFETSKIKAQKEIQKAVAAAAAASSKIEEDAAALRAGGSAAEAVSSTMGEPRVDNLYEIFDGQDEHFVTLPRLKSSITSSVRLPTPAKAEANASVVADTDNNNNNNNNHVEAVIVEETKGKRRGIASLPLPFPDARVLDFRLKILLAEVEKNLDGNEIMVFPDHCGINVKIWPFSDAVSASTAMRNAGLRKTLGMPVGKWTDHVVEYSGIGLNGSQCEVVHRTMDDRNDYSIGAASPDLAQIATGPDSHRYLRALGVPMTLGRLGIASLLHADEDCLENMLQNERKRFYGQEKPLDETSTTVKKEDCISSQTNADALQASESIDQSSKEGVNPTELDSSRNDGLSDHIPLVFRDNNGLRAAVCVLVLHCGYPLVNQNQTVVSNDITSMMLQQCGPSRGTTGTAASLFQSSSCTSMLKELCDDSTELPAPEVTEHYIQTCLLPHCLKLSLYGNGPTIQDARGSKGEFETALGTSLYQEPTDLLQSPLPDPCLPLNEQSIEAIGAAVAIIRRAKLMKCIQGIVLGKISTSTLSEILHSKVLRQSMNGLPVWWCPWIHDLVLLVNAGSRGLFAILKDRSTCETGSVFSQDSITRHLRKTFPLADDGWIDAAAFDFPTMNALERRLAFICAQATETLDGDWRFDNIPMFDHGGWPRN